MDFTAYISPELIGLVPILNAVGWFIKNKTQVKNKWIPLILGILSILASFAYTLKEAFTVQSVCTAIIQGLMLAGASVYANQLYKQLKG